MIKFQIIAMLKEYGNLGIIRSKLKLIHLGLEIQLSFLHSKLLPVSIALKALCNGLVWEMHCFICKSLCISCAISVISYNIPLWRRSGPYEEFYNYSFRFHTCVRLTRAERGNCIFQLKRWLNVCEKSRSPSA